MEQDKKYIMVFKNHKGKVIDIREATIEYFFRKDGSLTYPVARLVHDCIKTGSFSFGQKEVWWIL